MTESRAEAPTITIGGFTIEPGERHRFDLPAARLPTHIEMTIPVTVINARKAGPRVFLTAAIHGDELNGIEIIRRVLDDIDGPLTRGTLIAVPVVNVFGFIGQSRYLPDRRDLNRTFPGAKRGSLASRLAHLVLTEIIAQCTHGLDLHTAARDRTNFPQVRGNLRDAETRRIAEAFGAPVMVQSPGRSGSLRAAAVKRGASVLVYEGGEALRFDEDAITSGVRGVKGVLRELGMIRGRAGSRGRPSLFVEESKWVRARRGGVLRLDVREGQAVRTKQRLGVISDPLGDSPIELRAPTDGLVIGLLRNPVVHAGDAIVNIGILPPDSESSVTSG